MKNTVRYIVAKNYNGEEIGWLGSGPKMSKAFKNLVDKINSQDKDATVEALKKYIEYTNKNVNIGKDDIVAICNTLIDAVNNKNCIFEMPDYSDAEVEQTGANTVGLPFSPGDIVEVVEYDGNIISDDQSRMARVTPKAGDKYRVLPKNHDEHKVSVSVYGMIMCENIETGKVIPISPLCLKLSMSLDDFNVVSRAFSTAVCDVLDGVSEVKQAIKSGYFTEREVLAIVSACFRSIK